MQLQLKREPESSGPPCYKAHIAPAPVVYVFTTPTCSLQQVVPHVPSAPNTKPSSGASGPGKATFSISAEKNFRPKLPRFLEARASDLLVPAQKRLDALMCGMLLARVCGVRARRQVVFVRDRLHATELHNTRICNWSLLDSTATTDGATSTTAHDGKPCLLRAASFSRSDTLSALAAAPQLAYKPDNPIFGLGCVRVGSVTAAQAKSTLTQARYLFAEDGWPYPGEVARRRAFERAVLIARLSAHALCDVIQWKSAEVPSSLEISCCEWEGHMFCVAAPMAVRLEVHGL